MKSRRIGNRTRVNLVRSVVGVAIAGLLMAGAPQSRTPKPSQYAPAKDLAFQMKELVARMEKDLADEAEYGETQQGRVQKSANTLALLALVLGHHDQPNDYRKASGAVIHAATTLADNAGAYAAAKNALGELEGSFRVTSAKPVDWQPTGDMQQIMMEVPVLNTSLRRAINGRRFATSRDKGAALSATLAAIAAVCTGDDSYCSDDSDQAKWNAYCVAMRDAAAGCNRAIHANKADDAKEMVNKMMRSCDDCHESFRD